MTSAGRTGSRARNGGHDAANPGCSRYDSTSSTGTHASSRLSGSLMTGSNGVITSATSVEYVHTPMSYTLISRGATAARGTPASSADSRSAASQADSPW